MKRINRRPDWRTKPAKKTIPPLRGWAYINSPLFKIWLARQNGGYLATLDLVRNEIGTVPLSLGVVIYKHVSDKMRTDAM